jgi:hypothetical protein
MIVICDFMLTTLRLRGDELLVYAIIFGFTQEPECRWGFNTDYISKKLGLTEAAIDAICDSLVDKDLITFDNPHSVYVKDWE